MLNLHIKRERRGAVLMLVALGLVALLAMMGLVVDGGNLYLVRQKAQTAADASALAAAACIPRNDPAQWPTSETLRADMEASASNIAMLNASAGSGVQTEVIYPYQGDIYRVEVVNTTYFQPLFLAVINKPVITITNRAVATHTRGEALVNSTQSGTPNGPFGTTPGLYAKNVTLGDVTAPLSTPMLIVDAYDSTKGRYNAPLSGGGVNQSDTASVIGKNTVTMVAALNGTRIGGSITAGRYSQAGVAAGSTVTGDVVVTDSAASVYSPAGGIPLLTGALPAPKILGSLKYKTPASLLQPVGGTVTGGKFGGQAVTMPNVSLAEIDFTIPEDANNNAGIAANERTYLSNSSPPDLAMTATGSVLNLEAGTYYFRNVSLTGPNSRINILSSPVFIYVKDQMNVSNGSSINNNSKDPNRLQVFIGGTSGLVASLLNTWNFAGSFYGAIYAPHSSFTLLGGGEFFGNVIVGEHLTVALSGKFHVDEGLYWSTTNQGASAQGTNGQPLFKLTE